MATVTQKPDTLSLLRNLKPYVINTSESVTFRLLKGGEAILEETYYPDGTDYVTIDVQEVVAQYLSVIIPSSDSYAQESGIASFSAYVDSVSAGAFTVIPGGVRKLSDTAANWIKANWLTWQPQTKKVRWHQPEFLSYYHRQDSSVMARFYPIAGDPETVAVYSSSSGRLMTYNMEMAHLFSFSSYETKELNGYVDVWVEDADGVRLTYVQRYVHVPVDRTEHYYLAVNSLGGIDTFCFTGPLTLAPSVSHESADIADRHETITASPERAWQQGTGAFGKTESRWLWEFFASPRQWTIIEDNVEDIVLDSSSVKASDRDNLSSSSFSFALSEEGGLLKISRTVEDMPLIEVASPAGELFFLAPRVVDYPDASLTDDLLFLVQSPYVQEWKKMSLATLKLWIQSIFLPYEDLPLRMEIENDGDGFLAWGESCNITCRVWKGLYEEVTSQVTSWTITRNSGDSVEDAAWLTKAKVKQFGGSIEICFTSEENDLGTTTASEKTVFTVTAAIGTSAAAATIEI